VKRYLGKVFVEDQSKALEFYTSVLGFEKKLDVRIGEHRWLTFATKGQTDGMELLLEPDEHPAAKAFKSAIKTDIIPTTQLLVEDIDAEFDLLTATGVTFVQPPMDAGPVRMTVLDDTRGNLIQLVEVTAGSGQ
jgi:predicted enzyme related to lactoylglutathione lyase